MKLLSITLLLMGIFNLYFLIKDIILNGWSLNILIGMVLAGLGIYFFEKYRTK